jgi:hypothetical protein
MMWVVMMMAIAIIRLAERTVITGSGAIGCMLITQCYAII